MPSSLSIRTSSLLLIAGENCLGGDSYLSSRYCTNLFSGRPPSSFFLRRLVLNCFRDSKMDVRTSAVADAADLLLNEVLEVKEPSISTLVMNFENEFALWRHEYPTLPDCNL